MIWLCITSLFAITPVTSYQHIESSRIRVFPAENQSIAGVFTVSGLDDFSRSQYSFNASDARKLCSSLGVNIASKAQVQEALTRGLETCRRRSRALSFDVKQQQEYIQTEEWTCVKSIKETKETALEDERIEVDDDNAS
ncbi:hypothetical protein EYF80_003066 [Liparis tanakae]|uniref:Link domain-containing protein n=1 Tax=Liparis tanakae TaxID=230148 RepID=A0A4Z2JAA2_9TELE|nr:hypothetical protein EYF80_003066 [Liparis tanakae]